nr:hypothetical protein [Propionibacterium sp.]
MRRVTLAAAALGGVLLTGCAAGVPSQPPAATPPPVAAADLLARNGLQGLSAEQVVDRLDASEEDRTAGPVGSVRATELVLTDGQGQARLPLPADRFYLSIAPYLTTTHDCFDHNLASCKGELAGRTFHVTVRDAAGATLVDRDATAYGNGFAGLWLPRGITGTLTVTYEGKSATAAIATGAGDPTCLTTLKLT